MSIPLYFRCLIQDQQHGHNLKVDLLSVIFEPETAEIRLLVARQIRCNHQSCDISGYYYYYLLLLLCTGNVAIA